jgi:hypothetical protein
MYLLLPHRGRQSERMTVLQRIAAIRVRLAGSLSETFRDPVGERLDVERRRDGTMFRRHRAFLPWAP